MDIGVKDDDLVFTGGDMVVAESTLEHFTGLIADRAGDYKYSAATGVGVADYVDDDAGTLGADTAAVFVADGVDLEKVSVAGGNVVVKGEY